MKDVTDDYTSDTQTTGEVMVGGSTTGDIELPGDRDWFEVTLEAGKSYRIDLEGIWTDEGTIWPFEEGILVDPYLRGVHDANGVLLAGTTDDDGGYLAYNSRLFFTANEAGTYYIAAGANGDGSSQTGTYKLSVKEVADDYAAGIGTTGRVTVGGSATGNIDFLGDEDWFEATLEAGKSYQIDLEGSPTEEGTLTDPYLRGVHDANGVLIAGTTNNNGGTDHNSQLFFTAGEAGTYYVAAGADGSQSGTYKLSVKEVADDYVAWTGTTGKVTVGGSTTGDIEFSGDRDWFAVTLEAGTTYQIDLDGDTLWDPYLYGVHDSNGVLLADTADDGGGNGRGGSRVFFTAGEDGTYYVAAGADGSQSGTYTLSVKEVTDDYASDTQTTGKVTVGGSTTGDIEHPGDQDWFAVTLEAGTTYQIDLEGIWTWEAPLKGTLPNPYLRGVHDSNGVLLAGTTDDDGGTLYNSRLLFTAGDAGTYYIAAASADLFQMSTYGTYTLSVEEVM